jgi:hypothetical protein
MVEILAESFDVVWWRGYAEKLKKRFVQDTSLIRASAATCVSVSSCAGSPGGLEARPAICTDIVKLSGASSRRSGTKGGDETATLVPDAVLVRCSCDVRSAILLLFRHTGSMPSTSNNGHAAASIDEHVAHEADRLASTRARRAAAVRDLRSAGIVSPVPKYISSGVCPRNAECGSTDCAGRRRTPPVDGPWRCCPGSGGRAIDA